MTVLEEEYDTLSAQYCYAHAIKLCKLDDDAFHALLAMDALARLQVVL